MSPAGQVAAYAMAGIGILMSLYWLTQLKKHKQRAVVMVVAFLAFSTLAYAFATSWPISFLIAPGLVLIGALFFDIVLKARAQEDAK